MKKLLLDYKKFMKINLFILTISILLFSCKADIKLKYTVTIPSDLQEIMTFHAKDDVEGIELNAHEMYLTWHKEGWDHCIDDFLGSGFIDRSEIEQPSYKYGLKGVALDDGYNNCKAAIQELIAKHGKEKVKTALKVK